MNRLPSLSKLSADDAGWGYFLCAYKETRAGRSGSEFLFLSLQDATGQVVANSSYTWHSAPDGGCCFPTGDGGWVYVSNSEVSSAGGGVGVLRFDSTGAISNAYSILTGTNRNCAGGPTVAGKWFSCEEVSGGIVYECDPLTAGQGVVRPALGAFNHEAAFEDPVTGDVFLTEDDPSGRDRKSTRLNSSH